MIEEGCALILHLRRGNKIFAKGGEQIGKKK